MGRPILKCPDCKTENAQVARFCSNCGSSLSTWSDIASQDTVASNTFGYEQTPYKLGLVTAILLGYIRYFDFQGRSTRSEYWWWALFIFAIGTIFLGTLDNIAVNWPTPLNLLAVLNDLFSLATLIPSLALGARRLHDINRSAWWLLLWLAILVGWIILIVWACKQSDNGPNKYDRQ